MLTNKLTVTRLLLLQLLVAPLFLGPLYYDLPWRNRPFVGLTAILLAPACYVGVFVYRAVLRSIGQSAHPNRSIIFIAVTKGIAFGLLFGAMLSASLFVVSIRDILSEPRYQRGIIFTALHVAFIGAFILLHYVLIGASTGGLIGLGFDVFVGRKRSDSRHDTGIAL